jgi:hypothetical protein
MKSEIAPAASIALINNILTRLYIDSYFINSGLTLTSKFIYCSNCRDKWWQNGKICGSVSEPLKYSLQILRKTSLLEEGDLTDINGSLGSRL